MHLIIFMLIVYGVSLCRHADYHNLTSYSWVGFIVILAKQGPVYKYRKCEGVVCKLHKSSKLYVDVVA